MIRYQNSAWRESQRISLDYSYMMAQFIGHDQGLTQPELNSFSEVATKALVGYNSFRGTGETVWADLPYTDEIVAEILDAAKEIRAKFKNFVVLGIGGSALGTIALQRALLHPYYNNLSDAKRGGPRLFVLDNVDPDWLTSLLDIVDPAETCFNVISKSGSTAETMSQFVWIRRILKDRLGDGYGDHIIATTDVAKGSLRPVAVQEGYRTFVVPDGVGGRFSVLSPVGLLPAAVTGMDIRELLAGAAYADEATKGGDLWSNSALMYAVLNWLSYEQGRPETVMMPYAQTLKDMADWFCQLWAESLGKATHRDGKPAHVGGTPIKALGATDQHSQVQLYIEGPFNKVINFIRVDQFDTELTIPNDQLGQPAFDYLASHTFNELINAEQFATAAALAAAGRPNMTWNLPAVNAFTVGQLIYLLEVATAFAGELFNIDAFNQPGVEAGKVRTYALLGRPGFEEERNTMQAELRRVQETGFRI